ncbi:MAG TPA: TIGR03067 domain-containing protein [Candidatus Angelobacter sp.]|nr:TIGR03067 domain-containing protein [Candidatus Angelobacter sp.]
MKLRLTSVLVVLVCVSLLGFAQKQDKGSLQGKWRATEATSNGEPPPPGMLEKLILLFNGETVSVMGAAPTRFTIDNSYTPAHIDILNSRHQVGIYELKGDTLKICFGMDGDRPKAFSTEKHTDHTYMLLKRVKE